MEENNKKVTPLLFDTYIEMVRNSEGAKIFRTSYAEVSGEKNDITNNGKLSCAFFVSSILVILKLIKEMHVTVEGTVRDLESSGWVEIGETKEGAVIVWKKQDLGDGDPHAHIGFCLENGYAISNNAEKGYPEKHEVGQRGREVEKFLWNPKLDNVK